METAQKRQKEYYDNKHLVGNCFSVGSVVLKKDFMRKKRRGGKLDDKWLGPYTVVTSLGKGLFKLKELNGEKVNNTVVRGLYIQPSFQLANYMFLKHVPVGY